MTCSKPIIHRPFYSEAEDLFLHYANHPEFAKIRTIFDVEDLTHAQIFFRLLIEGRYKKANPIGLIPSQRLNSVQLYCPFEPICGPSETDNYETAECGVRYLQQEWRLDRRPPKKKPAKPPTSSSKQKPKPSKLSEAELAGVSTKETVSYLSVEILAASRGELLSDPQHDALLAIMFEHAPAGGLTPPRISVAAVRRPRPSMTDEHCTLADDDDDYGLGGVPAIEDALIVNHERELIKVFIYSVVALDPDVLCCWDTERGALDYISRRAQVHGINLEDSIKRLGSDITYNLEKIPLHRKNHVCLSTKVSRFSDWFERFYFEHYGNEDSNLHSIKKGFSEVIPGRFVVNLWRVSRHEYALTSYTLQNVVRHLTGKNFPVMHSKAITKSLQSCNLRERSRVFGYVVSLLKCMRTVLRHMSLIERTVEMAKVYTTDFASVLTRGSQFFIEAHLTRAAHLAGYILFSSTPKLLAAQPSLECIALNMEPPKVFVVE